MPAGYTHAVVTTEDSAGLGTHSMPISNIMHCVLNTLHLVLIDDVTTNVDPEPSRLIPIKIFQFVALVMIDPLAQQEFGERPTTCGLTEFWKGKVPDITKQDGLADLLALRSFVVIFLALGTESYLNLHKNGPLPVTETACREIQ